MYEDQEAWRFCAYESPEHHKRGEYFFEGVFTDHTKMKVFSANFSAENKPLYPKYCSTYWGIGSNATTDIEKREEKRFVALRNGEVL